MMKQLIQEKINEIKAKYIITTDKTINFKILSEIAYLRNGKIKEGEKYINAKTKMIFIDQLGNEFKMIPNHIKNGYWSPYESGTVRNPKYHMKELQKIALSKGGKIKEGEIYTNSKTKMTFIDKLGNEFEMIPNDIKNGCWSPFDSNKVINNPDYHMKELKKIALSKGGKIKEGESYTNSKTKMTFIDQLGNEFEINPSDLKKGRWSPYEKNCFEHICRQIIEKIYKYKFNSNWGIVKRGNGNKLQLDGYCKELGIAFEYQGIQHITGWKNDGDSLIDMIVRDNEKKQQCKDKKILLLEINYYKKIQHINDVIEQTIIDIKKSYNTHNLKIPLFINNLNIKEIKIDLSKISHLVLMQKQIEEIALSREGKIKEGEYYIGAKTKMIFIDKSGNEFKMAPSNVKSGQWSPYESERVRDSEYHMKQLEKIVLSKGGKIKEGEYYIGANTKMIFIDKLGNEFKMIPQSVKKGHWSPYESGTVCDSEYHMKQLEEIVLSKIGNIKEGESYINSKTKMTFIDQLGNEFKMTPCDIKSGYWSPYESGNVHNPEYHMKQLEKIVSSKGGKIKEGESYINSKTKMTFIDQLGNEFKMIPNNIKNGYWTTNNAKKIKVRKNNV